MPPRAPRSGGCLHAPCTRSQRRGPQAGWVHLHQLHVHVQPCIATSCMCMHSLASLHVHVRPCIATSAVCGAAQVCQDRDARARVRVRAVLCRCVNMVMEELGGEDEAAVRLCMCVRGRGCGAPVCACVCVCLCVRIYVHGWMDWLRREHACTHATACMLAGVISSTLRARGSLRMAHGRLRTQC